MLNIENKWKNWKYFDFAIVVLNTKFMVKDLIKLLTSIPV